MGDQQYYYQHVIPLSSGQYETLDDNAPLFESVNDTTYQKSKMTWGALKNILNVTVSGNDAQGTVTPGDAETVSPGDAAEEPVTEGEWTPELKKAYDDALLKYYNETHIAFFTEVAFVPILKFDKDSQLYLDDVHLFIVD